MSGRLLSALLAALLAEAAACAPQRPGDVLLITVDTLRPDHLGIYGYPRGTSPRIDSWFGRAAIFERAYSNQANTPPSVVSILSGLLPQEHGVRLFYQILPEQVAILPDLLPPEWQTAAFVSNVVLTNEAMAMGSRFDHFDDRVEVEAVSGPLPVYERTAKPTTDAVLRWLAGECDPERPLLLWVHYEDPHSPYTPPAEARRALRGEARVPPPPYPEYPGDAEDVAASGREKIDAYDGEIVHLDAQIGRLLEGFASRRNVDRALVLLTADHGESMMDHEMWFTHGYQVYEEIARVPLLLRGPGVQPGRRRMPTTSLDVAPTLLAFAGAVVPEALHGVDLRGQLLPADRVVFLEGSGWGRYWRAALRGDQKWVLSSKRGKRAIVEQRYYDLAQDPGELHPASALPEASPLRALRELMAADPDPGGTPARFQHGRRLRAPKVAPRATDEQLDKLRALGYVE